MTVSASDDMRAGRHEVAYASAVLSVALAGSVRPELQARAMRRLTTALRDAARAPFESISPRTASTKGKR